MQLTLTRPDDWHVHLRDGRALEAVLPCTAKRFGRAVVMPNLDPPLKTVAQVRAYRDRIVQARPPDSNFEPLMTLYLTQATTAEEIFSAKRAGLVAAKLYPAGATTHSDAGVADVEALDDVFRAMQEADLVLCVHGEVTDASVDVFEREAVFIERHLSRIVERSPRLRVVLEHVTTEQGVAFVEQARDGVGATITAHHLLFNRNNLLAGGVRPHYYCAPVLKAENHRRALVRAAVSGNPRFFLGTDSAPHSRRDKESSCGCAGIFNAHAAMELYAHVFEQADALHRLEAFAAHFGADFYGLSRNKDTITLERKSWRVPESIPFGDDELVPLHAGRELAWQCVDRP